MSIKPPGFLIDSIGNVDERLVALTELRHRLVTLAADSVGTNERQVEAAQRAAKMLERGLAIVHRDTLAAITEVTVAGMPKPEVR